MIKINKFYEKQTGLDAFRAKNRVEKILAFLESNNLNLNDVVIENHDDRYWNKRANRTEKEKRALLIGQTRGSKSGDKSSRLWVFEK